MPRRRFITQGGPGLNPEVVPTRTFMKKFIIAVTGGTVLLIGIAMIVLPGPALIVIPAGLAILATEFIWARHALKKCQNIAVQTTRKARGWWPFRKTGASKPSTYPEDQHAGQPPSSDGKPRHPVDSEG
jgi:hypothetical protein